MLERYKNILVINTFGIGDVLFSTPMVRALKENIPDARIDFMCNERCQYLMRSNKNISDIIVFEKDKYREAFKRSKIEFAKEIFRFAKKIRGAKYDLAVDLSLGHQISLLLKLLGIKKRIGFNYRNRGRFLTSKLDINGFNDKHVVESYLDVLSLIGITDGSGRNLELSLPPEFIKWADDFVHKNKLTTRRLIGIAPGGGKSWGKYSVYRRWSPQDFGYVARKLAEKEKNLSFLFFGSEEEKPLCRGIEERLGVNYMNLCGVLPLPKSIALIKKCELLLCNDGGILHIGVSQGIKTISIFGPVDDRVYGPYPPSDKHKVIKAEGIECRPCYKNFKHKMCDTHDCLKKIKPDEVLNLAEDSLGLLRLPQA
jgi:heptosyltransferase-2